MFRLSHSVSAVATVSLATLAVVDVQPAQATGNFTFEVELTDGTLFPGAFTFNTEFGVLDGDVEVFDLTSFDFDFLDTSFGLGSDSRVASLSGSPTVSFDAEGDILGLDFFTDAFLPSTSISFVPEDIIGDFQDSEFIFTTTAGVSGGGSVDFTAVPEPTAVFGLLALGVSGVFVRNKCSA